MNSARMTTLAEILRAEADKLLACIHCGLCLSACPTYLLVGDENDSPRGRLYLMRAVAEGRLSADQPAFRRHIDLCLGCRACETVCPSGVLYGRVLEAARAEIALRSTTPTDPATRLIRFALAHLFVSPRRLHLFFAPARWLRRSTLARIIIESRLLPARWEKALSLLLATAPTDGDRPLRSSGAERDRRVEAPPSSRSVAFFAGCVGRELFEHTNRATRRVLRAHGCAVTDPRDQVCCGALHAHAGDVENARRLARKNIAVFEAIGTVPIIVNVAGCGAMMKEYGHLLSSDPDFHARAAAFAARVRDISEYLIEIGFQPGPKPVAATVTYDAPCHLHHAQKVTRAPIELLRHLPGIRFVPLPEAEMCCGSAGIYNLLHPDWADAILQRKIEHIRRTGADILVTGNAGCLMQIASGLRRAGMTTQVMHPIELIAQTYPE